jgi:hypothetical protein
MLMEMGMMMMWALWMEKNTKHYRADLPKKGLSKQ